jgi:hypothetical protein
MMPNGGERRKNDRMAEVKIETCQTHKSSLKWSVNTQVFADFLA